MNDDGQVRYHHHPHRKPARTSHGNAKAGKTGGAGAGGTRRTRRAAKAKNAKAGNAAGTGAAPVRAKGHQHAAHVSTTTNPLVK